MEQTLPSERVSEQATLKIWDNSTRAKNLILIFWLIVGVTTFAVISDFWELSLLQLIQNGEEVDQETLESSDFRQGLFGLTNIALYIYSIVVFLNWFRRAYGNLHRIGVTYLDHQESMAVWAWVIPVISFYRPVKIMNEIWEVTQTQIKKFDTNYVIKSGGLLIGAWWTLFILSHFIGRYLFKAVLKQDTLEQLIESSQMTMVSD